ncbi:MAG TPA: non-ribosomal peptide synthetase [Candidatus Binatia bacterium]|nr:non-ribosomal peptide synthetase [Candidatus Binatia bacterium]
MPPTPAAQARVHPASGPPAGPARASVHGRVAAQAGRTPKAIAVRYGAATQTYAQLDARASAIAAALRAAGVAPGVYVALFCERALDLPAALLGILKTGAAYLPLDPELPRERVADMLADAEVAAILATGATHAELPAYSAPVLLLDDIALSAAGAAAETGPGDAAYIIYTSGSTGRPKGVVVTHANLVNFLDSMAGEPGLRPGDTLLAVTTISFDIAGLELLLPLVTGACVAIAARETVVDGERLREQVAAQGANVLQATPATWRLLLAAGWRGSRNFRALCGGEPLPRDLAAALLPRVRELWNLYGPTETTVWSTIFRVTDASAPILIGRPIANTQCYVLDTEGRLCPPGEIGELCIGGAGVARGYHRRPELTAERFAADPFLPGSRLYRTGDLARWTGDGQLDCLGRIDFQVKLRGFRVEVGEIEATLNGHPAVADSACGVREAAPGDARLVAWVQPRPGAKLEAAALTAHLRRRLPAYMLPQQYVVVEALPRLLNGKLDRKSLRDPFATLVLPTPAPPVGASLEQRLLAIWQEVLQSPAPPAADERFFEIGGTSLLAVTVMARVRDALGVRVPVTKFFAAPTLAQFAAMLERDYPRETGAWLAGKAEAAPTMPPPRVAIDPAPAVEHAV